MSNRMVYTRGRVSWARHREEPAIVVVVMQVCCSVVQRSKDETRRVCMGQEVIQSPKKKCRVPCFEVLILWLNFCPRFKVSCVTERPRRTSRGGGLSILYPTPCAYIFSTMHCPSSFLGLLIDVAALRDMLVLGRFVLQVGC